MLACFHNHTYRCGHAVGTEEEYINRAISQGLTVLGFADHAPMRYKNGFKSTYKMDADEAECYISTLLDLREKYKDKIDIKIGFETEYYPSLWDDCMSFWSSMPLDYLILGQHYVPDEYSGESFYSGSATFDETRVSLYFDSLIRGMRTGKITYVAHPDLINYVGDDIEFYIFESRRFITEAIRLGIPLEYNLLGMKLGRNYPNEIFWNEVADLGAECVIGCDAHAPRRVAEKDEIATARAFLHKRGIRLIDNIDLRLVKPF